MKLLKQLEMRTREELEEGCEDCKSRPAGGIAGILWKDTVRAFTGRIRTCTRIRRRFQGLAECAEKIFEGFALCPFTCTRQRRSIFLLHISTDGSCWQMPLLPVSVTSASISALAYLAVQLLCFLPADVVLTRTIA